MNFPIPLLQEAFRWTLGSSIRVSVLIILVLLAQKFLARHLTSGLRYGLSILVLIGLLMPVAPPSVFSLANVFTTTSGASAYSRPIPSPGAAPQALHQNMLEGTPTSTTSSSSVPTARPAKAQLSISQAAAVIWVSGASLLLVVAAWRFRKWTRLTKHGRLVTNQHLLGLLEESKRAMGVRRAVALVEVDRLSSPAVFGVWRVRLLLPELVLGQLSADELRMVLLHELAHVRRGDVLLNWVLMIMQFLHWFNPLVWLAIHRLRADRELACDALVLQKIPRDQHVGYGHVLIKLMEAFSPERPVFASAVPVVSSHGEIKMRLRMIRNHRQTSKAGRLWTVVLAVALGCATLTRAREDRSPEELNKFTDLPSLTNTYDHEIEEILDLTKQNRWEEAQAQAKILSDRDPKNLPLKRLRTWVDIKGQVLTKRAINPAARVRILLAVANINEDRTSAFINDVLFGTNFYGKAYLIESTTEQAPGTIAAILTPGQYVTAFKILADHFHSWRTVPASTAVSGDHLQIHLDWLPYEGGDFVELTPTVSANGLTVQLNITAHLRAYHDGHPVDRPIRASASVRDGQAVVLSETVESNGSQRIPNRARVLFVRVAITDPAGVPLQEWQDREMETRFYPNTKPHVWPAIPPQPGEVRPGDALNSSQLRSGLLQQSVSLHLDSVRLEDLFNTLGDAIRTKIVPEDSPALNQVVTVHFDHVTVQEIIRYFARSYGLQFDIGTDTIWVHETKQAH